jgi:hypothetical protein
MNRIQIKGTSNYVTSRGRDGAKLVWIFLVLVLHPLFGSLPSPKYQTSRFASSGLATWTASPTSGATYELERKTGDADRSKP